MILVDANLLVFAHIGSLPQHGKAREWLDERLNGAPPVGLPWPSLLGFLRLSANPRIEEWLSKELFLFLSQRYCVSSGPKSQMPHPTTG